VSKRAGLPDRVGLRQRDRHYVAGITSEEPESRYRHIPVEQVHPNPDQPRERVGSIEPLSESIKENGILQPIVVRRLGDKEFQIIAGERRYAAARLAGMREIPCFEREADLGKSLELALVENLLRNDLTPFEEAVAYQGLIEEHGYTHETLGVRIGKPRTTVTETLTLLNIPVEIRELCWSSGIQSRRQLLRVARQPDSEAMSALIRQMVKGVADPALRRKSASGKRARPFVFRYAPKGGPFRLQMTFRRSQVEQQEVVAALRELLQSLEASGENPPPTS